MLRQHRSCGVAMWRIDQIADTLLADVDAAGRPWWGKRLNGKRAGALGDLLSVLGEYVEPAPFVWVDICRECHPAAWAVLLRAQRLGVIDILNPIVWVEQIEAHGFRRGACDDCAGPTLDVIAGPLLILSLPEVQAPPAGTQSL